MEAVMKLIFISAIVAIANTSPCHAQQMAPNRFVEIQTQSQVAESTASLTKLAVIAKVHANIEPQFPEDLIPAVEASSASDERADLAFLSTAGTGLNLPPPDQPDDSQENPPIVVTGPQLPKPTPKADDPEAQLRQARREVARLEIAYHVLSVIDGIATVSCISRHVCIEKNPLMGSHPSALRVFGIKALTGLLFHRSIHNITKKNPYKARKMVQLAVGFQAVITGITMKTAF
jgi:hypothetical protein